jgi:alkylhydroperoxidase family enzyme
VDDDVWAAAADEFDEATLASLVQLIALINAFNRINVATERSAEDYAAYAKRRHST